MEWVKGRVRWGGAGCVSTRARRAPERATVRERTGLPPPTGTSSRGAPEGPLRSLARAQMASSRRYVPSQARWTRRSRPARCRLHRAQVGAHSARCRAHLAAARKRTLVVLKCKLRTSSENVPLTSGGPGPGRRLSPIAACRRAKESDLSKHPKITLHDAKMGTRGTAAPQRRRSGPLWSGALVGAASVRTKKGAPHPASSSGTHRRLTELLHRSVRARARRAAGGWGQGPRASAARGRDR